MELNKAKELFSKFLYTGDNYLLIEILNHYAQLTSFKADLENRKIKILKNYIRPLARLAVSDALEEIKALLKNVRNPNSYRVVLSLDSNLATTIYSSVSLVRPNPREVIDEADIDNLISQAVWRFFDRQRLKVAQKMGIDDIDVILSDVRIRGIKLDGHRIVNPIGFKAKSVEIFFSQTFMPREFVRGLKDFLPQESIALVTETGTAMSHVLSRVSGEKNFLLANLFPNETALFAASGGRLAHLDKFGWGENNLVDLLGKDLSLDPVSARAVIAGYSDNNASETFLRRFETILAKELQVFANGIENFADDETSVYLNSYFVLPPVVFSDRFQSRFGKQIRLSPLSTNLITEKLGFDVQFKKSVGVKNLFSFLAAFSEINFLPQNDRMSHLANRRVRWLIN